MFDPVIYYSANRKSTDCAESWVLFPTAADVMKEAGISEPLSRGREGEPGIASARLQWTLVLMRWSFGISKGSRELPLRYSRAVC